MNVTSFLRPLFLTAVILVASSTGIFAEKSIPAVVHSQVGDSSAGVKGSLRIKNVGKLQQYSAAQRATYDTDISSPKSVTFSRDGSLFYVNSLEGCKTAVYDSRTLEKQCVISYSFPSGQGDVWAAPSGYYPFTHYPDGQNKAFHGKPVESAWSHDGRYLWIPFYRRTFDINAQDPSAIAVIDTRTHTIVRMFETGPLPKMVACSPDGSLIAITHWGDNTVGMIDISSPDMKKWHHLEPITIGHKLTLNFPMDASVNRDSNSGYLLRGTVFTPDGRYLLVSGMAGPMAVIDVAAHTYIGQVPDIYGVRHLAIDRGYLYGSCNVAAKAIKVSLDSLTAGIDRAKSQGGRSIRFGGGIKAVKVGGGARTLDLSPDGKYIFVACNSGNAVFVVDAEKMTVVDNIRADSYPVGLALSPDGRRMIVTSQGRSGNGGNAVNIYAVDRPDLADPLPLSASTDNITPAENHADSIAAPRQATVSTSSRSGLWTIAGSILSAIAAVLLIGKSRRKK